MSDRRDPETFDLEKIIEEPPMAELARWISGAK